VSDVFDLEAEVRDLAARRDIMDACQRYMRAQDRLLPELHLTAFHEDAYVDCGLFKGAAAGFVDFAQGFLRDLKASQHLIGQHRIEFDRDGADGEVYFMAWHRIVEEGEEKDLFVCGRYVDRYEKKNGEWRIAKRCELIDWARTDRATDGFMKAHAASLVLGGRGTDDFSVTRDWPA
jgi:hypothetical protein